MSKKSTINETLLAENLRLKKEIAELRKSVNIPHGIESEKYRQLFENTPVAYQSLNRKGEIIDVNSTWLNVLGYQKNEVLNRKFSDFLHPEFKKTFSKAFNSFINKGSVSDQRFKLKHKKGNYIDVSYEGRVGYNSDNSFKQTFCVFHEITEQVQTEDAINAIATQFNSYAGIELFENVCKHLGKSLHVDYTLIGEFRDNNKIKVVSGINKGKKIIPFEYGLEHTPCENVVKQNVCSYPENIQSLFPKDQLLVEMGVDAYVGIPLLGKNNETLGIMVLMNSKPITNTELCKTILQIFSERISAEMLRLKSEEERKQSEERFRILIENAPEAVVVVDIDKDRFIDANSNAYELFKLPREELLTQGPSKRSPRFQPNGKPSVDVIKEKTELAYRGVPQIFEWIHLDSKGSEIMCEIRLVKLPSKSKRLVRGSIIDITERKNTALKLEKQRRQLENIILGTNAGTWVWNVQTGELDLDGKWAEIIGYTRAEIQPANFNTFKDKVHPDDFQGIESILGKVFTKESNFYDAIFRFRHKNGNWIWINARGKVFEWTDDGKPLVMSGVHLDITARKQIEERFKIIFESAPDSIFLYDLDGIFLDGNKAAKKLVGYEDEELIGTSIFDLGIFSDEDYRKASQTIENNYQGKSTGPEEFSIVRKDKTVVPVEISTYPTEINNTPVVLGIARDITQQNKTRQIHNVIYNIARAALTTENLRTLIGQIQNELSAFIDTKNFYIALYEKETDTLSLPFFVDEKDHFVSMPAGKTLTNYVIKTQQPLLADIDKIRELDKAGAVEAYGSDPAVWLGVPLAIENEIVGALAVQSYDNKDAFDDSDLKMLEFVSTQVSLSITRKKAEEELVRALEKAKESDRLKSAFLQNMSHEIRTPMNGILGFTQLLKEPGLSKDEKKQFIEIIEKSGTRMLSTINDILDISRIEAGQIEVQVGDVNINEQLDYLFTFFKPETDRKGMKLKVVKGWDSENAMIYSDREMIYAILTNLIKNAIKYTNEGSVEFGYDKETDHLRYFVRDTGIGIPKEKIKAIFERFVQVDQSLSSDYEGAGLGLSITKAYVEMLGGNIWVESEIGKGSTFYFTTPIKPVEKNNRKSKPGVVKTGENVSGKKIKILVADDEEIARAFLSRALKEISSEILFAKNGEETVDLCKKHNGIDVVLMDVKMPVLDGFTATKKIRAFNKDVVIIAQTAFALSGDKEKSFAAGCNDYISKPIDKTELFKKIRKNLN